METICRSRFPLYEVHIIGKAATGEPTLLSRGGLVNVCSSHFLLYEVQQIGKVDTGEPTILK